MKKILFSIFLIALIAGCSSVDDAISQAGQELNQTLSNISGSIADDLAQGVNDSIGGFIDGLNDSQNAQSASFEFKSPVSEFSSADISYLGIDCSSSANDLELANCIKNWQIENMDYDAAKPDSSYSIRWNYNFPGLYPTSEIIREKRDNERIYGICVDYALIYCSIADYYGLECRISNSITKPSDRDESLLPYATGLGMPEYNDLIIKLRKNGLDLPYETVRQIMKETPEHYWAEANIEGQWLPFDASNNPTGGNVKDEYIDANDYELTVWENDNTLSLIADYSPKSDDLGQTDRSFTIDEFFGSKISGSAIPAAYYNSCADVCGFFGGQNPTCAFECPFSAGFYTCYDSCSGKKFYKICDFVCTNDNEVEDCYLECSGEDLNLACFNDC